MQRKMARDLDALAMYDDFMNNIAPKLQQMIIDGTTATDVYKLAEAQMAARLLTIAMTSKDPKIAMQAIKEAHDRSLGKAKETTEITTRYEKLSDEELDALLQSQKESMDDTTSSDDVH